MRKPLANRPYILIAQGSDMSPSMADAFDATILAVADALVAAVIEGLSSGELYICQEGDRRAHEKVEYRDQGSGFGVEKDRQPRLPRRSGQCLSVAEQERPIGAFRQ